MTRNEKIVERSIKDWGKEINFNQANEELGELIVAINHFRRKRISFRSLIEEIADVSLILDLLTEIVAQDIDRSTLYIASDIQEIKQEKINRLERRLDGKE